MAKSLTINIIEEEDETTKLSVDCSISEEKITQYVKVTFEIIKDKNEKLYSLISSGVLSTCDRHTLESELTNMNFRNSDT